MYVQNCVAGLIMSVISAGGKMLQLEPLFLIRCLLASAGSEVCKAMVPEAFGVKMCGSKACK